MGEKYNKRAVGSQYEQLAAEYFIRLGYLILQRNFHAGRYGEIDIIAKDREGTLVICECKYRSGNSCGDPLEAVGYRKQRQISRAALFYLMRQGYGMDHPCRFDVVAVYGDGTIKHIENAFEFLV